MSYGFPKLDGAAYLTKQAMPVEAERGFFGPPSGLLSIAGPRPSVSSTLVITASPKMIS